MNMQEQSAIKQAHKSLTRAFQPGSCPHFESVWMTHPASTSRDAGSSRHKFQMRVTPHMGPSHNERYGRHADCSVGLNASERSAHGVDRTLELQVRVTGTRGYASPRRKTGKPYFSPRAEIVYRTHLSAGLCGATTKQGTLCQRKAQADTQLCGVHTQAATTAVR